MPDAQITDRLSPRHTLRPRCPQCRGRMEVQHVAPGRLGFEHWTLRCIKCGLIQDAQAQADPMKSEAVGWFNGELRPPK
jgi:tRNA(Ile2) C34 agmatinyltransferase TiaS